MKCGRATGGGKCDRPHGHSGFCLRAEDELFGHDYRAEHVATERARRIRSLAANMCGTLRLNPGNHLVMCSCLAEAARIIDALDALPVPEKGTE